MKKLVMSSLVSLPFFGLAQKVMPLYPAGQEPGKPCETKENRTFDEKSKREMISEVVSPTLTAYFPASKPKNGSLAVIVCPGGGYGRLAMTHEGYDVAKRFAEAGIAAFVLKYRLPNDACMEDKKTGPLQDAQQAIYLVRKNAREWGIDPAKIGIMGFSAGGHLAATASTQFNRTMVKNPENISLRPDFSMLIYPVISFSDLLTHGGSRTNLIGNPAAPQLIEQFSNEKQITKATPPAFLVHAADDQAVPVGNSLAYAEALISFQTPVQLHVFPAGGHGFGMVNPTTPSDWFLMGLDWLKGLK